MLETYRHNIHELDSCLQEEALLSLDMADRSTLARVAAALEQTIARHSTAAALQNCLRLDASLMVRYVKVGCP